MLQISVRGSAKLPYLIAANGAGSDLQIRCSCPAGAKGVFCKHIAAVLVGDISAVEGPTEAVVELGHRAVGSPLLARALAHVPRPARAQLDPAIEAAGIDGVVARYGDTLRAAGWKLQRATDGGDFPEDRLELFGTFKNGKPRKASSFELAYIENSYDAVAMGGDVYERRNPRRRVRPWGLRGAGGASLGTWASLSEALPAFLEAAKIS